MPTLYLVRHGRAAAGWDADPDPGLDELGRAQARRVADRLAARGPLDLIASPMMRTRETAAPLAEAWGIAPRIEPRISEIRAPVTDLKARADWLREIAVRRWTELDSSLRGWRDDVLNALAQTERDTVIVTHYVAINVAVGAATADDRVVSFAPAHCSITVLRNDAGRLDLIRLGEEADSRVL